VARVVHSVQWGVRGWGSRAPSTQLSGLMGLGYQVAQITDLQS
jgi:hypothetical protein